MKNKGNGNGNENRKNILELQSNSIQEIPLESTEETVETVLVGWVLSQCKATCIQVRQHLRDIFSTIQMV